MQEKNEFFTKEFYDRLNWGGIELHMLRNHVLEIVAKLRLLEEKINEIA